MYRRYSRERYASNAREHEAEMRSPRHRQHYHTQRDYSEEYEVDARREDFSRYENHRLHDGPHYHSRFVEEPQHRWSGYPHQRSYVQDEEVKKQEMSRTRYPRNETSTYLVGPSRTLLPRQLRFESPPPDPIPSSPSTEYLKIALEPSKSVPSPPRKLVILDLNGTLLIRARSLGTIYPRPFMASFRDFLFCPATRQWLDVMVWSSAQPHNVERMVRQCFFDSRLGPLPGSPDYEEVEESDLKEREDDKWDGKLVAVWARDTLGLSQEDYSRKSKTTKNLEKPWSMLPGNHSARTSVLLDDSPRKAHLQPYNHICVSEYSTRQRDHDMGLKRLLREREELEREELTKRSAKGDHAEEDKFGEESLVAHAYEADAEGLTEREKARKQKKAEKKRRLREKINAELAQLEQNSGYDTTLLSIIGILDALKYESNVAGWIRAGGLWAGNEPPSIENIAEQNFSMEGRGERASSPTTDLEVGEEERKRAVSPQAKRQRSSGYELPGSIGGDVKRTRPNSEGVVAEEGALIVAGNDAQTVGAVASGRETLAARAECRVNDGEGDRNEEEEEIVRMWFEDETTYQTWVQKGREVLRRLGIEERDSVYVD